MVETNISDNGELLVNIFDNKTFGDLEIKTFKL